MSNSIKRLQSDIVAEVITPAVAADYLKLNLKNRPLDKGNLAMLVSAINRDRYEPDVRWVAFAVDGSLVDGQHILNAIVHTGKSLELYVQRDVPNEAKGFYDNGKKRSLQNHLVINDKLVNRLQTQILQSLIYDGGTGSQIVEPLDIQYYVDLYDMYAASVEFASNFNTGIVNSWRGQIAKAHYNYRGIPKLIAKIEDFTYYTAKSKTRAEDSTANRGPMESFAIEVRKSKYVRNPGMQMRVCNIALYHHLKGNKTCGSFSANFSDKFSIKSDLKLLADLSK